MSDNGGHGFIKINHPRFLRVAQTRGA